MWSRWARAAAASPGSTRSARLRSARRARAPIPARYAIAAGASGGAGPLHVMAIARELHIPKVIVPLYPAHFSALGMLAADERHDFIRTFYADLDGADFRQLERTVEEMAAESAFALGNRKGA